MVQQNRISREEIGIYIQKCAGGMVTDNDVCQSLHPLVINSGSETVVSKNRFS